MKDGLPGRGQSTLELLIALGMLVVSVSAGIAVFSGGQSLLVDTKISNEASYLARELLENARSQARQNFSGLLGSSSTQGQFTKETIVSSTGAYLKKVTTRVSWQTDPLRAQKVELVSYLTDWRNVAPPPDPGDTGGGDPSGDWQNPRTLGTVDLGPGNSATDLDVISKIVYMTAEASAAAKPDFFVVNATDGQNPLIVSQLDTGPSLNALDTAGNYVYAANRSTALQLQIIDVSNPVSPVLVKSFQLPGVSGSGAVGNTIFYGYSKVFMGTKKATGPEFHIIDVSDPLNPVAMGSKEVNSDVNGIYVSGSSAYLANSDERELRVFDISNPTNIIEVGGFDAPGQSEDGKSIDLIGTKLYVGRLVGGNHDDHHEFHVVDVTTPSVPQNLGSRDLAADLNDLRVKGTLAFLGTSDPNKEFQVWNVSNPASAILWSAFNFPQVATGIDYEDNIVYVSVRSNDALRIITSQ